MKKNLKRILAISFFALLIALMTFVYAAFREKTVVGSKSISLCVINSSGSETLYSLKTDAEYLIGAMEEAAGLTFSGSEGPYGMMISTINGETADYSVNGAYWGFSVNGEYCNYGVSEQPVHDGDAFVIAYTR